ncbi:MAG: HEPN domain-containing protein [Ignavibacteriae bacterium]|nr:HEPN domain-containing protein [Ignavibacteriota bacterium]NOG99407.1 HEPN domain-containing protein [Ignavibacteriota bacterium]
MNKKPENIDDIVKNWLDSAEQNYTTMCNLLDSKDYSWALFIGHLVIEKTLKALYVKRLEQHAIFTHDLLRLATKIGVGMTNEQEEWLDKITTFNLNARYDNYKQDFNKLCTKDFTNKWILRIKNLREWLINQL